MVPPGITCAAQRCLTNPVGTDFGRLDFSEWFVSRSNRTTFAEIDAASERLRGPRAYCCRLLGRCRANPTVTAVLPNVCGRAQGAQVFRPEIETAIDEVYLRRGNPPTAMLMHEIEKRCFEGNLTPSSRKAVMPANRDKPVSIYC